MKPETPVLDCATRARFWAAIRSLGRDGIAVLFDRHYALAKRLAHGLSAAGYTVLNDVVLHQDQFRLDSVEAAHAAHVAALARDPRCHKSALTEHLHGRACYPYEL